MSWWEYIFGALEFNEIVEHLYSGADNMTMLYLTNPKSIFALLATSAIMLFHYFGSTVKRPKLRVCKDSKLDKFVNKNILDVHKAFFPTIWCFGPQGQSVIPEMIRNVFPSKKYQRETIVLKDCGQILLDWYDQDDNVLNKVKPIVLLVDGLDSVSYNGIIKSLGKVAHNLNFRVVRMHFRGCGGMVLTSPKITDFLDYEDIAEIAWIIKRRYSEAHLIGIGVFKGGYLLSRYLCQTGAKSLIDAAFAISVPFDFRELKKSLLGGGIKKRYSQLLGASSKNILKNNTPLLEKTLGKKVDIKKTLTCDDFDDINEIFISKLYGYKTVEQYYDELTLVNKLSTIKRPVLFLNANDDFLCPCTPGEEFDKTPMVAMIQTVAGGHCGFMDGMIPLQVFLAERICHDFLHGISNLGPDIVSELSG